ncbi:hypothetical protein NDU88_006444 [Pleurodeles waltl]|uniref:Uncharacterized protein n=1 Tax=Pleurodeles waltl TaxID=8319 RepID=A0AAV7SPM7_PLEWA|nr:hypothetical protein NDU88_006444 [Pleurodeles waltl]
MNGRSVSAAVPLFQLKHCSRSKSARPSRVVDKASEREQERRIEATGWTGERRWCRSATTPAFNPLNQCLGVPSTIKEAASIYSQFR